ncbi:MAG: cytochrome c biogenesis protein CcsA [Aquificae bacterium]|nr:cytochrome c biogenesis protein CcsA [Aquificota bacterium]
MATVETAIQERNKLLRVVLAFVNTLFSMNTTLFLLFVFAVASGIATFIETEYGRDAAREMVYNTRWFEAIITLLALSALYNIFRYRMWKRKKWPLLVAHFSFLLIFAGAALTRYAGEEGVLHIREGDTTNKGVSYDHYFMVKVREGEAVFEGLSKRIISPLTKAGFEESVKVGETKEVKVRALEYLPYAKAEVVPEKGGEPVVHIVLEGGFDAILRKGSVYDARLFRFHFGEEDPEDKRFIKVYFKEGKAYMVSDAPMEWFRMDGTKGGDIKAGEEFPLEQRRLYRREGIVFTVLDAYPEARVKVSPDETPVRNMERQLSAMKLEVEYNGKRGETLLLFVKEGGFTYLPSRVKLGNATVEVAYGQKVIELPFYMKLEDFIIERYPGSQAPSSYESRVVVIDPERGVEFPYRIYMNHTLDYRGYRFFQMSYDPDERGTILSFNRDPGVLPTYIGYTILSLGLLFFAGLKIKRTLMSALLLVAMLPVFSWSFPTMGMSDPSRALEIVQKIDREVAEEFCRLTVQSADGRMETLHTFALEVANKVHGKPEILGLTPCQALLGMMTLPIHWQVLPVVRVDHPEVRKKLGLLPDQKYVSYLQAMNPDGTYKLMRETEIANRKEPPKRTKFDKEVLKVTERLSILYMIFVGDLPRIFPLKGDPNDTWYGLNVAVNQFPQEEARKISAFMKDFYSGVLLGVNHGDWSLFRKALEDLREYQKENGGHLVLSEERVKAEILYNKINIFERLTVPYLILGLLFFVVFIAQSVKEDSRLLKLARASLLTVYAVLTLALIVGLGLRWYIAGHAPWSNAYESIVFMGASAAFGGLLFMKKHFAPLAGSLMAGAFLFIAHLSWLDPQITTLVPVLKSYWLIFHSGVTVASYGFLGISAVLGLVSLVLLLLPLRIKAQNFREMIRVNELSMLVGFVLLNIGNILGAVWANESWGRYWGWDPKETWTLVTILVYAIVLHLKYTPMYSHFTFIVLSVFAYFSVLMTYFGVNFLLSGLHSYASGDFSLPTWVYYAVAGLVALSGVAFFRRSRLKGVS